MIPTGVSSLWWEIVPTGEPRREAVVGLEPKVLVTARLLKGFYGQTLAITCGMVSILKHLSN